MPSSASNVSLPTITIAALAAIAARRPSGPAHFGVVPFRRDASGAIVPGATVEVPNGDIAWRRARADAFDHDNVGAVVLIGSEVAVTGRFTDGALLAAFGDVDIEALAE